jgi:hypothetical protein
MSGLLKRQTPAVLGLVGGVLGLVFYNYLMSPSLNLDGCSCGWRPVEGIVTGPVVVGSLIGLVGCAIALSSIRVLEDLSYSLEALSLLPRSSILNLQYPCSGP